ncbi:MAG: NADH-quinone oxidoreductase subunit NuoH [Planctomycetes bacterium]|nr:NADH-quinone oxidoreductase subunit NuoH [Planctomycetota bacterium]
MPDWLPDFITPQLIVSVGVILVIIHLIAVGALYLVLLERKLSAWMQDRCGPNRVGPLGLLQPIADAIKLILKEDFIPTRADRVLFILAPAFALIPALISFAIIPWAGTLQIGSETIEITAANVNIGVVYLVAITSLGVYGVALAGWSSNNKYSFFGGLRASAQMISYEIPMGLAILTLILTAGTVRPDEMIEQQLQGQWFVIHQPIAALLFYVCMLAETNRLPFDLAEAESELVGGFHTEYSSMKWVLFFLAEYGHIIVGSAFFTVLFLGGWSINPLWGLDLPMAGGIGMILLQFGIVMTKVFAMICLTMALRWTLPRFRYDQLMRLAWEGMIPTALLVLLVTSFVVFMGWLPMMWLASLITVFVIWLVRPLLPQQADPNRRLPLLGSRFSPKTHEALLSSPVEPKGVDAVATGDD